MVSDRQIAEAAAALRAGGLAAFPTETVYGLGALAEDEAAVARLYAAKGRPQFNPLILHVADLDQGLGLFALEPPAAEVCARLAARFWPGPLSLVAKARDDLGARLARAGSPTVAVRVPDHPVASALLAAVAAPVAAPSANPSGRISPTTAAHVRDGLGDRAGLILDGGPTRVGLESTVISVAPDGALTELRPGGVSRAAAAAAAGRAVASADDCGETSPASPGRLASHYAPRAALRLDAAHRAAGEAWLGFGRDGADVADPMVRNLSISGDLIEAAAGLFAALHALDAALSAAGGGRIAAAPIPHHGLGVAINDRLRRAAAPRP